MGCVQANIRSAAVTLRHRGMDSFNAKTVHKNRACFAAPFAHTWSTNPSQVRTVGELGFYVTTQDTSVGPTESASRLPNNLGAGISGRNLSTTRA